MSVFSLLPSDAREGFASMSRSGLLAMLLLGASVVAFAVLVEISGIDRSNLTMADFLASMFGGMAVFHPELGQPFELPISWMLTMLLMLFLPLSYPLRDMRGFGLHVLVASSDRKSWWMAKCLWLFVYTIAFWAVALAISCLMALICSARIDFVLSEDAGFLLRIDTFAFVSTPWSKPLFAWLGAAVLMSWGLCLVQFALSLWIKPVLSYAFSIALLFSSAFFFNPLLPGEYLMMGRSSLVVRDGVDPLAGLIFAVALVVLALVAGGFRFVRMDLIDREFSS